jgi:hypothetical protein
VPGEVAGERQQRTGQNTTDSLQVGTGERGGMRQNMTDSLQVGPGERGGMHQGRLQGRDNR